MPKAFLTGISGQCGSYLAELLLEKGYEVHGIIRRSSSLNTSRIDHIFNDLHLHYGDLTDSGRLNKILHQIHPEKIFNLGAQSHVRISFDCPEYTADVDALGTLKLLEAVRSNCPEAKFYQASSSEMFGKVREIPQTETTPFYPRSIYGVSKLFSYWSAINYREAYNMFICNGILYNNESPRRGETFVTKKIVKAAVRIKKGLQRILLLGNLDAKRDWGYSKEYVEAMYLMLQQPLADDYVIATGETHSVREFLNEVFTYLGLEHYSNYVGVDARYYRPTEVDLLQGDASKAKRIFGWEPKVKFKELVRLMVDAELAL